MPDNTNAPVNDAVTRWGPFTGRHLTIMFVALVVGAVVIPASAWAAVSFSNVAITDPGGVNRATVDAHGNLQTKVNGMADSPGRSAFHVTLGVHFSDQSPFGTNPAITVPSGKRFVIRDVNIYASVAPGQRVPDAVLNVGDSTGHTFSHAFLLSFVGAETASGTDALVSQTQTMIYAGAGTQVKALAIRSASTGTGSVTFTLSGDLINCGAPPGCTASEALDG
jgi:hypothetical protein